MFSGPLHKNKLLVDENVNTGQNADHYCHSGSRNDKQPPSTQHQKHRSRKQQWFNFQHVSVDNACLINYYLKRSICFQDTSMLLHFCLFFFAFLEFFVFFFGFFFSAFCFPLFNFVALLLSPCFSAFACDVCFTFLFFKFSHTFLLSQFCFLIFDCCALHSSAFLLPSLASLLFYFSDCARFSLFSFSLAALPCFDCLLFSLLDCFPLPLLFLSF